MTERSDYTRATLELVREGKTEYYTTQLKGWSLTSNPDTFRQGVTASRNAGDWAKEKRDEFISSANERRRRDDSQLGSSGPSRASTHF